MATTPSPRAHVWYTPAWCAEQLGGTRHGERWRARCPAHDGDNPEALGMAQGTDKYGNPMTLLHCFARQCRIEDICAALGIAVRNLFCMTPEYYEMMRPFPPAKSPRIAKLTAMIEPTPDEVAQILLEELIVSDPAFLQACLPARQQLWELASSTPSARAALTKALMAAHLNPTRFWEQLAVEFPRMPGHD